MRFDELEIIDLNENDDSFLKETTDVIHEDVYGSRYKDEDNQEINWIQELKSILFTIVITVFVVFILKSYVIINAKVPTGSMENTILPGDNLLGFRVAYLLEEPERGDVIFFYFPDDESQKFVKRIIGLPGEKVVIQDAKIYIDDSEIPLEEDYLKEEWITGTGPYEFHVPEDSYFVLGDNRNGSADARYWRNPFVSEEKIIGKAIFTYYPFDRWGFVE